MGLYMFKREYMCFDDSFDSFANYPNRRRPPALNEKYQASHIKVNTIIYSFK